MIKYGTSLALIAACLAGGCSDVEPGELSIDSSDFGTESASDDIFQEELTSLDQDPFVAALDHVRFATEDNWVEIQAYTVDDEIIGSVLVAFYDDSSTVTALFDDGAVEIQLLGTTVASIESDIPHEVLTQRANALVLELDGPGTSVSEGWFKCAALGIGTVVACGAPGASLILCGTGAFLATCECAAQLAKKRGWDHEEC
jgi:hypothetical protein